MKAFASCIFVLAAMTAICLCLPSPADAGLFWNRDTAGCPSCANGQCPMQQPATAAPIPHFVPTNDPPAPVTPPPTIPPVPENAIVVPAEITAAAQKCEASLLAVQAAAAKKANLATQIEALQKQLAEASDGSAEKQLADDYANFQKLTGQRYAPKAAK